MNSTAKKTLASRNNTNEVAILFENYLCITKFNVMTGEYRLIRSYQDNRHRKAESSETIYGYFKEMVESGIIHPDDRELIQRYMNPKYLADRLFRGEAGIRKVIFMSVKEISKKWTMPVRDWGLAYSQFAIFFEDRFAA